MLQRSAVSASERTEEHERRASLRLVRGGPVSSASASSLLNSSMEEEEARKAPPPSPPPPSPPPPSPRLSIIIIISSSAAHTTLCTVDTAYSVCGCHSCDSNGLALTGPHSHLCCGLCERHCSATDLTPTGDWRLGVR